MRPVHIGIRSGHYNPMQQESPYSSALMRVQYARYSVCSLATTRLSTTLQVALCGPSLTCALGAP